ncbi:hypothetical protein D3C80_2112560 [compost metagenome]
MENPDHRNFGIRKLDEVYGVEAKYSQNRSENAFERIAGIGNQSVDNAHGV